MKFDWDRIRWLLEDDDVLYRVIGHAMSAEESVNLTLTGGVAVVILGHGLDIPTDYAFHPQVVPLLASELSRDEEEISGKIPSTTRLILIGGDIESHKFGAIRSALTRRSLTFIQRRNQAALTDALFRHLPLKKQVLVDAINTETAIKKRLIAPHGAIADFVRKEADLSKGSGEEARRLFHIAQQRELTTTVASLAQAIAVAKRKGGRTETPRSIMSAQQKALQTLDDVIAGLQLVREYVAETEMLNIELNRKLEAFKAILK